MANWNPPKEDRVLKESWFSSRPQVKPLWACWAMLLLLLAASAGCKKPDIKLGSKAFTENAILGEMAALLAEHKGLTTSHTKELGTRNLWDAMLNGDIDVYPEYTGTIREEIFAGESLPDEEALRAMLKEHGILMTGEFGFNNTYALGMREDVAERLGITKISDLTKHPDLAFGFSNEFMDRADGWPSLRDEYGLPHTDVRGLEHSMAYQAVEGGELDLTDIYSTDAKVKRYGLRVLQDDRLHFPGYRALFLYREDLEERHPEFVRTLELLNGTINDKQMLKLNERVELDAETDQQVAASFLQARLDIQMEVKRNSLLSRLSWTTREHLFLVVTSLAAAIAVAVPLGIVAAKKPVAGQFIVGGAEIVQTIPGLALLIFLAVGFSRVGLPTIGALPVIVALFLYSLLPIIRNTMTGLTEVPNTLRESAVALGLTPKARLLLVELPLASRLILAGIKTTAVINVGYAALGGLIGAGGYGQPIMTGLRLSSEARMLEGAVPAAVLALIVKWGFELSERFIVPMGLRIKPTH